MLAPETIAEIQRLLAQRKHTHRQIAQRMGVSRGSVGAIALGRRHIGDPPGPGEGEGGEPSDPPVRCAGCGAMVYLPCVLCRVTSKRRKHPRTAEPSEAGGPAESADFDLRPDHRARYEEVRRRRHETGQEGKPRRQIDKELQVA